MGRGVQDQGAFWKKTATFQVEFDTCWLLCSFISLPGVTLWIGVRYPKGTTGGKRPDPVGSVAERALSWREGKKGDGRIETGGPI